MNFFDLANISHKPAWQRTWYTRQERIKREGSEYFTWPVPATGPAATSHIEIAHQFPRAKKYEPLDFIEVANNDVVDLTLTINGSETLPVPAATIRQVTNKAAWEIAITNNDAATTSTLNSIIVTLRREPLTIDKYVRQRR